MSNTIMNPILSRGALTVLLAPEVTDADARWLLGVITDHWYEDIVPEYVPDHLALITRMVIAEQDTIKENLAERHEKRVAAANKRWNSNAKDAMQCNGIQSNAKDAMQCNVNFALHKIKESKVKENNNTEKEINKEKAPLLPEVSVGIGVGDMIFSSSGSGSGSVHYASDPAMYAMNLVGRNNKRDYQTFSGFLRKLGRHEFCDIVNEFDSQKRQGEMASVHNLAAVLVNKLKQAKKEQQ